MLLLRRHSRVSDLNISKDQRKKHRPYYNAFLKFSTIGMFWDANNDVSNFLK